MPKDKKTKPLESKPSGPMKPDPDLVNTVRKGKDCKSESDKGYDKIRLLKYQRLYFIES